MRDSVNIAGDENELETIFWNVLIMVPEMRCRLENGSTVNSSARSVH